MKIPFFDIQINGYMGVDFNTDDLSSDAMHKACEALKHHGVDGILATIVTDNLDRMCARLRRLVDIREQDSLVREIVSGLHVEGPFLNETTGYRGAHPLDAIRRADTSQMEQLIEAGGGWVRLVTLAPERDDGAAVTRLLKKHGITIAAGHTDASRDDLRRAIDAGLTLFTHLGNGCPMQMHRHDNIIQRVLSMGNAIIPTLIADGAHLPFFTLQNIIRLVGVRNCIIVTDAMTAAGQGPGQYTLGRWTVQIGEDGVARSPDHSHLVGSTITMPKSAENLRRELGLSEQDIAQMMSTTPRRAVGTETAS